MVGDASMMEEMAFDVAFAPWQRERSQVLQGIAVLWQESKMPRPTLGPRPFSGRFEDQGHDHDGCHVGGSHAAGLYLLRFTGL